MAQRNFYTRWNKIVQRCCKPNDANYSKYGLRGIKVCERWLKFENFKADMFPTFKEGLTIERIDNDGDYCPENCRWATYKEQANNKRSNRVITYEGLTKNITQWAAYLGIKSSTLRQRFYVYKWNIEKCFYYRRGVI